MNHRLGRTLFPIFLVGLLAIIGIMPYARQWIARRQSQRKHRDAMARYKPELLAVISQFRKGTNSAFANSPARTLHAISGKPDYGGVDYTAETDHFRTLQSWGLRVQENLRSSDGPFELSASEALEYALLYLQHVERIGWKLKSQIGRRRCGRRSVEKSSL